MTYLLGQNQALDRVRIALGAPGQGEKGTLQCMDHTVLQPSSLKPQQESRNLQPSTGGSAAIVHACSSHAPLPPVPIVCTTRPHQGVASRCLVCIPGRASPLRSPFLRRSVTRTVFAHLPTRSGWKDALLVNRGNCSCSLWLSWQLRQMLRAQLSRVEASHGSPLLPGVVT